MTDQLTLQAGASKVLITVLCHDAPAVACFQMMTVRSSEQLAIVLNATAVLGAQATSLTQSVWLEPTPVCRASSVHGPSAPMERQIRTTLSQPPVTRRRTGVPSSSIEPIAL